MFIPSDITYFGKVDYRNKDDFFGIRQIDRLQHFYVLGRTGTGKSNLLLTKFLQDIYHGRGCCFIDPHGDSIDSIKQQIPKWREKDVIDLDLTSPTTTLRYNPLKRVSVEKRSLVASSILEAFKKLWKDGWGVRLEHILRNVLMALLDQKTATLADIPKILLDKQFRNSCIKNITNEEVLFFWQQEYNRYQRGDILPVLNKVSAFLVHPINKRILVDNPNELSLRKIIDEGKILLVNSSKGIVGEDVAHTIGALLVTSISSASFSRSNITEEQRKPFFLYLDEFQNFTTLSLVNMLSELRKYKVGMVMAHQYIHQIEPEVRHAILGNIGTLVSFRIGAEDAAWLANAMYPNFQMEDFLNLPNYKMFLTLMINGTPSRPFSAKSIHSSDMMDYCSYFKNQD